MEEIIYHTEYHTEDEGKTVIIHEGITTIPHSAFYNNRKITKVVMSESVKVIKDDFCMS